MLAKIWKRVLLAICIVACIFNLMSKLVNRHSLKENLKNANDGSTVFDFFKSSDVKATQGTDILDDTMNEKTHVENNNAEGYDDNSENIEETVEEDEIYSTDKDNVIIDEENENIENDNEIKENKKS